jgi:hypothetical protein
MSSHQRGCYIRTMTTRVQLKETLVVFPMGGSCECLFYLNTFCIPDPNENTSKSLEGAKIWTWVPNPRTTVQARASSDLLDSSHLMLCNNGLFQAMN